MDSISTLRRSATDPKVSGLAAGLARTWNVDPVLVRVGFVVLALSGGIGIILYLAGWLMVPLEGRDTSYLDDAIPQTRKWSQGVKIGIVVVACLIGAAALSWIAPFSMSAALVVAAIWYFGYYRNRPDQHRSRPKQPKQPAEAPDDAEPEREQTRFIEYTEQTPFTEAAQAWQQRIVEHLSVIRAEQSVRDDSRAAQPSASYADHPAEPYAPAVTEPVDAGRDAYFSHPDPVGLYTDENPTARPVAPVIDPAIARRKRRGRKLTLISLIAVGLAMTGLGIASAAGAAIATGTYLAVALLVLGLALLVGAVVGRPPVVAFLAICVAVSMVATLFAGPYVAKASVRSVNYTAATLPASDHLDVGQLTVDLREVKLKKSQTYTAGVDAGRLEVFLPAGQPVIVEGNVDQGMLQLPGDVVQTGSDLRVRWPAQGPPAADDPVLTIRLNVDRGQLEVHR